MCSVKNTVLLFEAYSTYKPHAPILISKFKQVKQKFDLKYLSFELFSQKLRGSFYLQFIQFQRDIRTGEFKRFLVEHLQNQGRNIDINLMVENLPEQESCMNEDI